MIGGPPQARLKGDAKRPPEEARAAFLSADFIPKAPPRAVVAAHHPTSHRFVPPPDQNSGHCLATTAVSRRISQSYSDLCVSLAWILPIISLTKRFSLAAACRVLARCCSQAQAAYSFRTLFPLPYIRARIPTMPVHRCAAGSSRRFSQAPRMPYESQETGPFACLKPPSRPPDSGPPFMSDEPGYLNAPALLLHHCRSSNGYSRRSRLTPARRRPAQVGRIIPGRF